MFVIFTIIIVIVIIIIMIIVIIIIVIVIRIISNEFSHSNLKKNQIIWFIDIRLTSEFIRYGYRCSKKLKLTYFEA